MAYIKRRKYKNKSVGYQAIVRRKGFRTVVKSFQTRTEAKKWSRQMEIKLDRGDVYCALCAKERSTFLVVGGRIKLITKMNNKIAQFLSHTILILGVLLMVVPIWITFASSTHENVTFITEGMQWGLGDQLVRNYNEVLNQKGGFSQEITATSMFINSFIMALGIATVKVIISSMSAYALVYFRFKLAVPLFWLIFITLLVPLEVRIIPSYQVVSALHLTNTYTGLILPLVASATATFFFRQFYKSVPDELLEAAKLDGANSWKFFIDFLVPLSKTMMAAMFIFMFVYGYSQYLWPLIMTTDEKYWTVVMGMKIIYLETDNVEFSREAERFAYIILSMIPPIVVVVFLQRWFIKGLIQTDK